MKHYVCKSTLLVALMTLCTGFAVVNAAADKNIETYSNSVMTTSYYESTNGQTQSQTVTFHQRIADNGSESSSSFAMDSTNGGNMSFTASHQQLDSDFVGKNMKSIDLKIINQSKWTGSVNNDKKAIFVKITLDKTSSWEASADSHITVLDDADITLKNIKSKFNIYYDAKAMGNEWLGGKTYQLNGGGQLIPNI